jgi:hypothetical protein
MYDAALARGGGDRLVGVHTHDTEHRGVVGHGAGHGSGNVAALESGTAW